MTKTVGASDIKLDETVVFFATSGWQDASGEHWHLPVHGWIYEPQDSKVRKAAFAKLLDSKYDLTVSEESAANFSRRLNLLVADNERGKTIVVTMAGRDHALAASAENGHFASTIVLSAKDVEQYSSDGFIEYTASSSGARPRTFSGSVKLIDPSGVSVISDIDDTVKISNVGDHRSLLESTFLLDFAAAPGMSELYQGWSEDSDVAFHFVSSSPWQLYSPLREFMRDNHFPTATFSLKPVRFRDETLFDLFKKGTETKPPAIEAILDRYKARTFILVGDSGEQDPEVYAAILRERPEQIAKIYIRNVTRESADNARFSAVFEGISGDRWLLFDDPKNLSFPEVDDVAAVSDK